MTPFKNFSKNPAWQHRLKRGSMYVAVALMLGGATGCGNDNGGDWEEVTTYEVTKGVVTTLEETEPGQFAIVDEQVVGSKNDSRVIVKRLNGTVDTLNLDAARGLVSAQDTVTVVQNDQHYHSHGMGHVLWWGAMGYMMGRNFNTPVQSYVYRDGWRGSPSGFHTGRFAGEELRGTAIARTELRPIKGRTGFFKRGVWGRGG